ncbi:protein MFI [Mastacembelus armatus]|uniref:protein MFI n=1 Tax=Mastacembelus armatus TaxID=205130 RepID=UPI000E4556AB|nr:uncharacterized protein C11orf65 homolog [Mastacembelus armatus]
MLRKKYQDVVKNSLEKKGPAELQQEPPQDPQQELQQEPQQDPQQELQREPQQETLQQIAARTIQKAWERYVCREVFKYFKKLISHFNQRDPQSVLKTVNPREAELLDAAAGVFIRFRLGGINFPPNIYYKIFKYRPIADMCASSPKDYTQPGLKKPVAPQTNSGWPVIQEDRSGWYRRVENNSWRLFCCKLVSMAEIIELGANKTMDFHYSKLQRQQDVGRWRKKRNTEWLKQMTDCSVYCLLLTPAHTTIQEAIQLIGSSSALTHCTDAGRHFVYELKTQNV